MTILALVGLVWATQGADASHQPADKVSVAASGVETTPAISTLPNAPADTEITVLTTKMKVSSPTDLILSLSAECALWTNTSTMGDDDQESKARVEMWVEIDGTPVPVAADEGPGVPGSFDPDDMAEPARVVFCNRAQRMKTEGFVDSEDDEDSNDVIRLFNRTRSANAFTWVANDAGRPPYDKNNDNILDIVVKARLAAQVLCDPGPAPEDPACAPSFAGPPQNPAARAAVGKRTLVIEPTKLVNDAGH